VNVKIDTDSIYGSYISTVRAHDDSESGYVGAQTTVLKRLALTGQVREDATSVSGDAVTWRFGGVFDLPEILSHLKASYGTGFRAPALYDRYGIDSYGYVGNPTLRPEYSRGYELGVTTDLPIGPQPDSVSVTSTYFNNRIHDLIEIEYAANYVSSSPVNIDRARTQGVEQSITLRLGRWLAADLGYTYTDARDLVTGGLLLRRPYNQGFGNLRIVPFPGFVVAPELIYTGSFQDYLTSNAGVPEPYTGLSPSGLIFNLSLYWQVTPAVQVFVWGKNLGNSNFEPVNGYQTPGASFMAGTRLTY
jgi:vitamin B12 transporter